MSKTIATTALLFLLLGCNRAAQSPSATISFKEADASGGAVRELTFALTNTPAKTCIFGDWKEAKAVDDVRQYTKNPAYTWKEGRLEVLLVNAACDSYDSYIGTVSSGVFKGEHVVYGLGSSKSLGNVSGTYAKP